MHNPRTGEVCLAALSQASKGLFRAPKSTQVEKINPSLTLRGRFPWPATAMLSKHPRKRPHDGTDPRVGVFEYEAHLF